APHDVLVRAPVAASLVAHGRLAPRRLRLTADGRLALAAAMGMVARVHRRAADVRAPAHMATPPGLAQLDRPVLGVAHLANGGHAGHVDTPHLAGRQTHLRLGPLFRHELRPDAATAHNLAAAPGLELDVVDDGTDRNVP